MPPRRPDYHRRRGRELFSLASQIRSEAWWVSVLAESPGEGVRSYARIREHLRQTARQLEFLARRLREW